MRKLVLSEKAYDDLLRILQYIAGDKPRVAAQFVDQLEEQCKFLAHFPDSGTRRDDLAMDLRVFTYRGYGIYFRKLPDCVRIERVLPPGLDTTQQPFAGSLREQRIARRGARDPAPTTNPCFHAKLDSLRQASVVVSLKCPVSAGDSHRLTTAPVHRYNSAILHTMGTLLLFTLVTFARVAERAIQR